MTKPDEQHAPAALVRAFPRPGPAIALARRELDIAENGTVEQRRALGNLADLPRPWAPATCTSLQLRTELWAWLDAVVVWINHELVFDPTDVIPPCWPLHPHLVHEIAVLADLRSRGESALRSDHLEEWYRYALPSFLERTRRRVADHCGERHPTKWPASGRFTRHFAASQAADRQRAFVDDLAASQAATEGAFKSERLRVVDRTTGEVFD